MDLTVDVVEISVEPEYPVSEVRQTETFFVNNREVQLVEEVMNNDMTVDEFLAHVEALRAARMNGGTVPEKSVGTKPKGDVAEVQVSGVGEGDRGANEQPNVVRPPQSLEPLEPGKDIFTVYFPQGKSSLDAIDQQVINKLPPTKCYRVAGYASPEGSAAFNLRLSEERANSVASAIKEAGHLVLAAGGLGEYSAKIWPHPWPIERRVEIYAVKCPAN